MHCKCKKKYIINQLKIIIDMTFMLIVFNVNKFIIYDKLWLNHDIKKFRLQVYNFFSFYYCLNLIKKLKYVPITSTF